MSQIKYAYFASGCFWGTEYFFENFKGVKSAVSGYMGGHTENPTYEMVSTGMSGHLEVVRVEYDASIVSFKQLSIQFFETHDFTQINGQGPDIGSQYLSAIFCNDEEEKTISYELIVQLTQKGYEVATSVYDMAKFYEAESYHQDYYERQGKTPYCHIYRKVF